MVRDNKTYYTIELSKKVISEDTPELDFLCGPDKPYVKLEMITAEELDAVGLPGLAGKLEKLQVEVQIRDAKKRVQYLEMLRDLQDQENE